MVKKDEVIDVLDVTLRQKKGQEEDVQEYLDYLYTEDGIPLVEKLLKKHPLSVPSEPKGFWARLLEVFSGK